MKMILPPIIMLIAGASVGAGISTISWSVLLDKSHARQERLFKIVKDYEDVAQKWKDNSDRFEKVANECLSSR